MARKKDKFPKEIKRKHKGRMRLGIMIGNKFYPYDRRTWAWKHRKELKKKGVM